MKFLRFRIKKLNVLLPSYLKATHRKPITADPRTATSAEVIIELGRGRNKSRTTPNSGAAMTIEAKEYCLEGVEKSSLNDPEEEEGPHLCKKSASSRQRGQYSAIVTFSHLLG